jgi:non-ribosomal peptide synthetase component F
MQKKNALFEKTGLKSTPVGRDARQASIAGALLAAFCVLLSRLSGETDLVVGTVFSGRDFPGNNGVVGPLADWLVLRLAVDRTSDRFASVVARARAELLSAIGHQNMPFALLLDELANDGGQQVSMLMILVFGIHFFFIYCRSIILHCLQFYSCLHHNLDVVRM